MERLGYQRMADFLNAYQDGDELNSALAYLHKDDAVQMDRLTYAVTKAIVAAFGGDKKPKPQELDEDEEIIDTTDPSFAEHFQGFTEIPGQR